MPVRSEERHSLPMEPSFLARSRLPAMRLICLDPPLPDAAYPTDAIKEGTPIWPK